MDNAKMGELIREARKEKGFTQKDVAERLGITDRAVSKWERGICAPDIAYIEELAEIPCFFREEETKSFMRLNFT